MNAGDAQAGDRATPELWRLEARAVARIAAPAAITQLGLMAMGAVDAMMLGRYSAEALAAGALGHSMSMGVIILAQGLLMAIDTLVAQPWGAGDRQRVRFHLQQGLMLALAVSLPIGILLWDVGPLLGWFGQQESIIGPTAVYVRNVTLGVPAFLMFVAVRRGLQAMNVVRPALVAIILANAINVLANWVLVFGHLGAPRLGVLGSAWATAVSRWAMFLLLIWLAQSRLRPLRLLRQWPRPQLGEFRLFFRIGIPIAIHTGVEFWMIVGMALMMGSIGAVELAGHQAALILSALAYMVSLGISGAAAARVGQAVGAGDMARAKVASWVSLALSVGVMSVSALLFLLFPITFSRLFSEEVEVITVAATLLPIAALFQIVDGLQVVSTGILRGMADTRVPAAIALLGYWGLSLPLGYALLHRWEMGFVGPWWGLVVGLATTALLLLTRALKHLSRPVETLQLGSG